MPKEDSRRTIVKKLAEKGKKNGSLSDREILDALEAVELDPDQIDAIYSKFEKDGIEITGDNDSVVEAEEEEEEKTEEADSEIEEPDEDTLK